MCNLLHSFCDTILCFFINFDNWSKSNTRFWSFNLQSRRISFFLFKRRCMLACGRSYQCFGWLRRKKIVFITKIRKLWLLNFDCILARICTSCWFRLQRIEIRCQVIECFMQIFFFFNWWTKAIHFLILLFWLYIGFLITLL